MINDPFSRLPYDLLHTLFSHLPKASFLNLILASWPVNCATRNHPAFWKNHMRAAMPWFWEMDELIKQPQPQDIDYRRFYFWLDQNTTPTFAMGPPFLGIANRRRIWYACEQMASAYHKKLLPEVSTADDAANAVDFESCRCLEMPLVSYPQPSPKTTKTVNTQWVYSWSEVEKQPSMLETFWRGDSNMLVGLSLTFGGSRRVFGHAEEGVDATESMPIKPGDIIKSITIHIPQMCLRSTDDGTAICGLEVSFRMPVLST